MRRWILVFLLCSVLAGGNIPADLQGGYGTIQTKDLKADLTFLASDQLEGRLSLTRGSEIAVQWIQSEFTKAGLKPLAGESFMKSQGGRLDAPRDPLLRSYHKLIRNSVGLIYVYSDNLDR